jgi:type IV fimbrial biogenesis protein FimT
MKRQQGFTLLELIVAVTVAGLFLSMAVPGYLSFVRNSTQITSANELLASLLHARDLAITKNVRVTVCPSSAGTNCNAVGWNSGWIVFLDADGDRDVDAGETIESATKSVGTPSVVSAEFNYVIFRPNGRAMAATTADNTGNLTFCDARGAAYARVVNIDVSGRPRVSRKLNDGSNPTCP